MCTRFRLLALLLAAVVVVISTIAHAGNIEIVISPTGTVYIYYKAKVTITNVSDTEAKWWKGFVTSVEATKHAVRSILSEVIARHLIHDLGYRNVTVQVLDFDYTVSVSNYTLNITLWLAMKLKIPVNITPLSTNINVKFRYMAPDYNDTRFTHNGIPLNPAKMFFIYWRAFDVPLDLWTRHFNGTHTIFTYSANITVTTPFGTVVSLDPTEEIVVLGYATGSGDVISISNVPFYFLGLIAVIIIIAIISAVVGIIWKRRRKSRIATRTPVFS